MSVRFSLAQLSALTLVSGALVSGLTFISSAHAADVAAPSSSARTEPRSEVGTLNCDISPSIGVIIGSQQDVECVFKPVGKNAVAERYKGTITKIGVDIGFTNGGKIAWAVWAPTVRPEGALKGSYVGASANAAIGIGGGTNILTGGSWKTISLQPISLQGQKGLSAAVGVSQLKLDYAG